jgi:hypothetical protein
VFVGVIDDEADLAYLFKEALSKIDGAQVSLLPILRSLWNIFKQTIKITEL